MWWSNKIPFGAVIFETVVTLVLLSFTVLITIRLFQRRKKPVLYLSLTFGIFTLASLATTIGRWIGFFSKQSYLDVSYTDLSTMISYLLIALSNCFVIAFVEVVFMHKGVDLVLPFFIANGIIIGFTISLIQYWFTDSSFGLIRNNFAIIASLAVMSLLSYGLLAVFAFRESKLNDEKLPRIGFNLIAVYGLSVIMMFICFTGDTILISSTAPALDIFDQGYTFFYYLGWIFAMSGVILGYLGYSMPNWFRNLIDRPKT